MKYTNDPEILSLYARLNDLLGLSERGEITATSFLTPRECLYAASFCEARIREGGAFLWGGFPLSDGDTPPERRRMLFLPEYAVGFASPDALAQDPVAALSSTGLDELAGYAADSVRILQIKGSGFRKLSHRDYLGSVLGLGLERSVIGDIFVADEFSAYLACKGDLADFLVSNLTNVSADTVRVSLLPVGFVPPVERKRLAIRDTVASERLDAVIAAIYNLPRSKAAQLFSDGMVFIGGKMVRSPGQAVAENAVVSVRHLGRFVYCGIVKETRKGRLRVTVKVY